MSRTYAKLIDKHQNHPRVDFQEYLYNTNEPQKSVSGHSSAELEAMLLEDIATMRRRFRHLSYRMRNRST